MQAYGNDPHEPEKQISKFQGPPEWCGVRRRVLYKICKKKIKKKKSVFRARAPRGRDAWASLIGTKSYSILTTKISVTPTLQLQGLIWTLTRQSVF
jgi:hypothetical protein